MKFYFFFKFEIYDSKEKKPIEITTSDIIQQYLLKNEANYNSIKGKNQSNNNKNNQINVVKILI